MSFKKYLIEQSKKEIDDQLMGAIIEFFSKNANATDEEVHELSNSLGVDYTKLEEKIYSLLGSFFANGKYNQNPVDPDMKELEKGIKHEMEHTTSEVIAKRIALDHLAEDPEYYTKLEHIEKGE
jgi:hypothetical protein